MCCNNGDNLIVWKWCEAANTSGEALLTFRSGADAKIGILIALNVSM